MITEIKKKRRSSTSGIKKLTKTVSTIATVLTVLLDRVDAIDQKSKENARIEATMEAFNSLPTVKPIKEIKSEFEVYKNIEISEPKAMSRNHFLHAEPNRYVTSNYLDEYKEQHAKLKASNRYIMACDGFSANYVFLLLDALFALRQDVDFNYMNKGLITITCDFSSVESRLTHSLYNSESKCMSLLWLDGSFENRKKYHIRDNEPSQIPIDLFISYLMSGCIISYLDTTEEVPDGRSIHDILTEVHGSDSYELIEPSEMLKALLIQDCVLQSIFYKLKDIKELREKDMFAEYDKNRGEVYRIAVSNLFAQKYNKALRSFN